MHEASTHQRPSLESTGGPEPADVPLAGEDFGPAGVMGVPAPSRHLSRIAIRKSPADLPRASFRGFSTEQAEPEEGDA